MFSQTISAEICGVEARKIIIEADVSEGMPMFSMVGFLSSAVKEAQERVRTALKNMGVTLPARRITVNLAPANLRKESTSCDLAIAIAILSALDILPADSTKGILFAGELRLNGALGPVRGVLEIAAAAKRMGCTCCIVPEENLMEGSAVEGVRVLGAKTLQQVFLFLKNGEPLKSMHINIEETRLRQQRLKMPDFSDLHGQKGLRRAAEVAVAGFHNLLLIGPPGGGKTMTAKRLPSILPEPGYEEILEISRIHSIAGTLSAEDGLLCVRPFRAPHHTITTAGMAGGGLVPAPGEITLAHKGVLFLDELPEFQNAALEILRQPMEEKKIVISRQSGTYEFPADFMLVAAMNPCKCGYYPNREKCRCTQRDVRRYLSHISQPLLDRIDLCVEASEISYDELTAAQQEENSASIRERVIAAQTIQRERYLGTSFMYNSQLDGKAVAKYCSLGKTEEKLMRQIYRKLHLTGRSYMKLLKVSRTIADLYNEETIREEHLAEAAAYRMIDRKFWENGGER